MHLYLDFANYRVEGLSGLHYIKSKQRRISTRTFIYGLLNVHGIYIQPITKPDFKITFRINFIRRFKHEQHVTDLIHAIYKAALDASDLELLNIKLKKEQLEEEVSAQE